MTCFFRVIVEGRGDASKFQNKGEFLVWLSVFAREVLSTPNANQEQGCTRQRCERLAAVTSKEETQSEKICRFRKKETRPSVTAPKGQPSNFAFMQNMKNCTRPKS